ncbi:hypothetical protein AK812_SmicGene25706 [Symbiodinium microadriaticum]|uniref:C3H1-type domain-containing protein n=1 Tax=Symbiodinium microadriaticum TaxID=2951 RepID=A0A1Q9DB93_SYMMI|nr:hypothetical protein AK812_SmicGene25706 [Symbiodinium microadriaticum]
MDRSWGCQAAPGLPTPSPAVGPIRSDFSTESDVAVRPSASQSLRMASEDARQQESTSISPAAPAQRGELQSLRAAGPMAVISSPRPSVDHVCRPCALLHSKIGCRRGSSCPYCHEHTQRFSNEEGQLHRPRKTLRNKIKRQMQEQLIEFDRSPDRVHDEWQVLVQHCRYAWNYLSGPFFTQLEDVLSGEVQVQNGMIFSV